MLKDHEDKRKDHEEYWKTIADDQAKIIQRILGEKKSYHDILRTIDLIDTNGIEIFNEVRAVFPVVSLLSHNCISNARMNLQRKHPYKAVCRLVLLYFITIIRHLRFDT